MRVIAMSNPMLFNLMSINNTLDQMNDLELNGYSCMVCKRQVLEHQQCSMECLNKKFQMKHLVSIWLINIKLHGTIDL
jgi:hypothetical protein